MKCIVADRFARGLAHPSIEGLAQSLTFVLNCEVDQGGRTAERSSTCAGFKVVGAGCAAEWHVEMSMDVDSAREHEFAGGVDNLRRVLGRKIRPDRRDL